jgi:Fe2+ or Zn2+ uptake regulation protein
MPLDAGGGLDQPEDVVEHLLSEVTPQLDVVHGPSVAGIMRGVDVAHRLRGEGYRLTPQRQLIWDTLRRASRHLTAEEIHDEVSKIVPDFNVASVYRTLTLLSELQLVKEIRLGDGKGHWEVAHPDDEFHLRCRMCGSVTHHTGGLVEQIRVHLSDGHGFTTESVDLVVHGICADCHDGSAAHEADR